MLWPANRVARETGLPFCRDSIPNCFGPPRLEHINSPVVGTNDERRGGPLRVDGASHESAVTHRSFRKYFECAKAQTVFTDASFFEATGSGNMTSSESKRTYLDNMVSCKFGMKHREFLFRRMLS